MVFLLFELSYTPVLDAFPDVQGGIELLIGNSTYATVKSHYSKVSCQTFDTPCVSFEDLPRAPVDDCRQSEVNLKKAKLTNIKDLQEGYTR